MNKTLKLSDDVTLIQGDCLGIMPTLKNISAVITDPPYNVGKDYGIHNDSMLNGEYEEWARSRTDICLTLCKTQFWVAPRYKMALWLSLLPNAHLVVIRRGASGPNRQGWSDQFETALAIGKPAHAPKDLWDGIRLKGEGYFFTEETWEHPGYTPIKIMERAILALTKESDTILDPFSGTGTTGLACIKCKRKYIGIEIEPKYNEIARQRLSYELSQGKLAL
jgi:DNA modification methylase